MIMNNDKSLFTYFLEAFTKNYINGKGRARKKEYWAFMLFMLPIFLILGMLSVTGIGAIVGLVVLLAAFPARISLVIRRLHDANLSGWFALYNLIAFIPVIGEILLFIIEIIIGLLPGTVGENKFGADPLATGIQPKEEKQLQAEEKQPQALENTNQ